MSESDTTAINRSIDDDVLLSTRLAEQQKWLETQSVCHRILSRAPDNPVAYHLLGVIAYSNALYDISIGLFKRSIELKPHQDVYRNLGLALEKRGWQREAIAAYQNALSVDPTSAEAHNALGHALAQSGEETEAITAYQKALELKPGFRVAVENLLLFRPLKHWAEICGSALAVASIERLDRYLLLVSLAVSGWSTGRYEEVRKALVEAEAIRPSLDGAEVHTQNMNAFENLVSHLITYRELNPNMYAVAAEKEIYAIGDSHILSYANTILTLDGVPHKIKANALISDQAWKFAEGTPNRYVSAFRHACRAIQPKSTLICSFGEIDCRINDGIMKYLRATGRDAATLIPIEAIRYVARLADLAKERELKLLFLTPPAPHREALAAGGAPVSAKDRADHADIVKLFTRNLREAAYEWGHGVIDVYRATVAPSGFSHGKFHIDLNHLSPNALQFAPLTLPRVKV